MPRTGPGALVRAAARRLFERHGRVVLAVSGGLDSMVLLDAAAAVAPTEVAAVATFDHGTGEYAAAAVALVRERARALGLPVVWERAAPGAATEAAWRAARWSFLRRTAERLGAAVVTAHTRDDQVETVLMRVMRGAGARGLAALYAQSPVARPWLDLSRATLAAYAAERGVVHLEDPTNLSLRFFRNRVRHEILPALVRVRPALPEELLAVARAAADWRADVERVVAGLGAVVAADGSLHIARDSLLGYDPRTLCVLWPALAARVRVTLDRRGTHRVAEFTKDGESGSRIQLSGGWEVERHRDQLVLRRLRDASPDVGPRPLRGTVALGSWRLRPATDVPTDPRWAAVLPADRPLTVRGWRPGDRMRASGEVEPRRVKRFLRDAGIVGPDRAGWPVVLAGDELVWIPGVRRSDAAPVRSGRPGLLYVCERIDN